VTPAAWPRDGSAWTRLLHVDPAAGTFTDRMIADLPTLLGPEDLLVVNDAGTVPASLAGAADGQPIEVRLAAPGEGPTEWTAVLFGTGSWRQRTEDRPPPPRLRAGDRIELGPDLRAEVRRVWPISPRLVDLSLESAAGGVWPALFRAGRPVQYSHLAGPLALWDVQTPYGSRPWAVEAPSAGRPLTIALIQDLRRRGIRLERLTHAAGLSSTGDPAIDAWLPLPERYEIPPGTVEAVAGTRAKGGRVVAVGTTVVRALEGAAAANGGRLRAGAGVTDLRVGRQHQPRVVNGLLTGLHEPGTSHFSLASAFAPPALLQAAFLHAEERGYLGHEFGDSSLLLPFTLPGRWC
jgi:S-adenosylmethionine:tRNA ribosyltransferase-isomerase